MCGNNWKMIGRTFCPAHSKQINQIFLLTRSRSFWLPVGERNYLWWASPLCGEQRSFFAAAASTLVSLASGRLVHCVPAQGLHPSEDPAYMVCKGCAARGPVKTELRAIKWDSLAYRKMSSCIIICACPLSWRKSWVALHSGICLATKDASTGNEGCNHGPHLRESGTLIV